MRSERAVTEYISHDGKQCYRVFGNIPHFQDLCECANIEWKWIDDFQMTAKVLILNLNIASTISFLRLKNNLKKLYFKRLTE